MEHKSVFLREALKRRFLKNRFRKIIVFTQRKIEFWHFYRFRIEWAIFKNRKFWKLKLKSENHKIGISDLKNWNILICYPLYFFAWKWCSLRGLRAQISGSYLDPEMLQNPNRHKLIKNQNAELSLKTFDIQICWFAVFARIALYAAAVWNKEKYHIECKCPTQANSRQVWGVSTYLIQNNCFIQRINRRKQRR